MVEVDGVRVGGCSVGVGVGVGTVGEVQAEGVRVRDWSCPVTPVGVDIVAAGWAVGGWCWDMVVMEV